jgi:hypothetical protein
MSARGLAGPRWSGLPACHTSTGPRIRNFMVATPSSLPGRRACCTSGGRFMTGAISGRHVVGAVRRHLDGWPIGEQARRATPAVVRSDTVQTAGRRERSAIRPFRVSVSAAAAAAPASFQVLSIIYPVFLKCVLVGYGCGPMRT